jgi:hypothetical protein
MSCETRRAVLAATLVAALPSAGAQAGEATRPGRLDVVGACPEGAVVRRLVERLVTAEEWKAAVSMQDQGPQYRIAVDGNATTLADPARDCAARARQAAVVVASGLRSHQQVFGPPKWTVEKGLVFEVASSGGSAVWAPGAELRTAYGSGRWSLVGAAGARGPVTLTFSEVWKAELLRLPLDIGARATTHWGRLRAWVVLGPSLTVTSFLGQELLEADRKWRADPGALAMFGATLPAMGRIGVAAALSARWQPRQYRLRVVPEGQVGETPAWWFGLSLDYTIDGKPTSL